MITQVRIYTINKGQMDSWIEAFNKHIVPTSASYGVHVKFAYANRAQNEFVWARDYESEEVLDKYEKSPERASYSKVTGGHIAKIEVRTVEDVLKS